LLVYRIARAPERRVFYVDVGQLPKQKAEQYMRDMMSRFRTRLIYNQDTGEIRDERKFMSVLEDYWLPRREGSRGTEITTLPGAQSLSQIEDAEYFKKKLYGALNVPLSRLTPESNGFNMGRSTEITREEIKFYKFIDRLKEAEILSERIKMLSFVEPYIGKYFSTDYVKTNILKYLPEDLIELEKQMQIDRQRIAQEQAAMAAQQAAQAQEGQPQ